MARSKLKSIRIPHPIAEGLRIQREKGVFNYDSDNAVLVALGLYQLLCPGPHHLTEPIARMGQQDQDAIHDFALALTEKGLKYRSQLLEHLLREGKYTPTDQSLDLATPLLKLARQWKADSESFDWSQIGKDPNQLELPL